MKDLLSHVSKVLKSEYLESTTEPRDKARLKKVNDYMDTADNPLNMVVLKISDYDGMEWNALKRAMRSVRSFSFVGETSRVEA